MTVEASMIMMLVLAVIVLMIYFAFCTYNRCVGSQDAYVLCMREAQHKDNQNTRSAERVEEMQDAQFGSKYIAVSFVGGSAVVSGDKVTYEGKAVTGSAVSLTHLVLPQDHWTMKFSGSSQVRDPAFHVRQIRRTVSVVRQIKERLSGAEEIGGEGQ